MTFSVSTEELISFHSVDREVYSRLVRKLCCDSFMAMRAMAFWLWLEESGFPSILLSLPSSPDNVVSALFQEAMTILNFMGANSVPSSSTPNVIPNTYNFTSKRITLKFLYEKRFEALSGISKTVSEVFIPIFEDIIPNGMDQRNVYQKSAWNEKFNTPVLPYVPHAFHPGFRSVLQFKGLGSVKVGESQGKQLADDRTMFLTFSRGYPISEEELRKYFKKNNGNVVQEVQMEETAPDVQPLWARVVFSKASVVSKILNGRKKIKFTIKGKHVWARQFLSV